MRAGPSGVTAAARGARPSSYPCRTKSLFPLSFPLWEFPCLEHVVYFTDRGIEELESRRGEEDVSLGWVAERLREFVDLNPDFEIPVERLATWLARLDDEDEDDV